jgi:uncharacterized protein (UPF0303 family)
MSVQTDLEAVIRQEQGLVFQRFDEDVAFAIGSHVREAAKGMNRGVAVEVRLWDRPLFFGATAGATMNNRMWVERKANTVRLQLKSTYRLVLERGDKPRVWEPSSGYDSKDYAIAGGGFPIRLDGVGVIGAATASGLPERGDHNVVVAAICAALGQDPAQWALPPLE